MFFFSYFYPRNNTLKQSYLNNNKIITTPTFKSKTTNLWNVIYRAKKTLIK